MCLCLFVVWLSRSAYVCLLQVISKIQESTYSDKVDEDQVKHALADPEIQALLADPQFRLTLSSLQENPTKLLRWGVAVCC